MLSRWKFNTHTDFIAPGQSGKTFAEIHDGRIHILAGNQIIRQAWKADLYEADVAFTAIANPNYKVRLLNPSDVSVSYNPFKLSGDLSTHVENLSKAIVENVSSDKTRDVPTYAEAAEPFFAYLAVSGETPFTARRLFANPKEWFWAAPKVPEPYGSHLRRIARLSAREFEMQTGTLRRRLRPFINSNALRKFTGSPNGVNVSELLKDGYSIFFNGAPSAYLSFEAARVINGLFLSDLMRFGIENPNRHKETKRGIFCYADEVQWFAPADFAGTIDTVLGAGLRFTLIHHHGGQFPDALRDSVETNARIKILGGGLSYKVRQEYAELAYAREINKDMHRQPQLSHITEYEDEEYDEVTESSGGSEGFVGEHESGSSSESVSVKHGTRLRPHSVQVQTGWDDYSREQKVSMYAENFLVPDRTFTAILPDGKVERFKVPTLRSYLYNSPEVLKFIGNQPKHEPQPDPTERSNDATPKRTRKKSASLFNAKR